MGRYNFVVGGTYEVETKDTVREGRTLTNITKAKQVGSMPAAETIKNGNPHPSNGKDEQIFVVALLKSFIEAGEIKNDKTQLWEATKMLRGLWKHSFGSDDRIFPASEAGRHAA